MSITANKITMESQAFQEIVNRVRRFGRVDEYGNFHLGHWTYRIEDGGMTDVVVNPHIGMMYSRSGNNEVEGQHIKEE